MSFALCVCPTGGGVGEDRFQYPPMQKGASFNLDAVKEKIADALKTQQQ
jgi:hypothetical protein